MMFSGTRAAMVGLAAGILVLGFGRPITLQFNRFVKVAAALGVADARDRDITRWRRPSKPD